MKNLIGHYAHKWSVTAWLSYFIFKARGVTIVKIHILVQSVDFAGFY